jgi:hypothetical protein
MVGVLMKLRVSLIGYPPLFRIPNDNVAPPRISCKLTERTPLMDMIDSA